MRTLTLLLLIGCGGYQEADFIPAKTDAFCELYLECADPQVITFDGMDMSRCVSTYGPSFQLEQEQCKLAKKFAKECVAALESMTCPSENISPDALLDALPASCGLARKKCLGGQPLPPDNEPGDTGS